MRIRRFVYAALIATGALAVAAPIAGATPTATPTTASPAAPRQDSNQSQSDEWKQDPSKANIHVYPGKAAPGVGVTVELYCGAEVNPAAVNAPALQLGKARVVEGTVYIMDAKVKSDAKPGKHTVSFKCPSKTVSTTFEVTGAKAKQDDKKPVKQQQVKVKPKGAAQTGGGATAL